MGRRARARGRARRLPARAARDVPRSTSSGRRVVLDCANGATHRAAPPSSSASAPTSRRSATSPTAATSTRAAARPIRRRSPSASPSRGAEIGFAFDGDGDRVIAVDGDGSVRDGDELIALSRAGTSPTTGAARRRRRRDGDEQLRLPPGDGGRRDRGRDDPGRRPARRRPSSSSGGWTLGGEQSGHIIWTEFAPTGDGIAAALLVLRALGDAPARRRPSRWRSCRRCS